MASKTLRVPLIVSMHGYDAFLPRSVSPVAIRKRSERRLCLRNAISVVVNSEYMRSRALEIGVRPDSIFLIRHGVDTNVFRPSTASRRGVLFVGRLAPEKGCDLLILALSRIPSSDYEVLTIVGSGPQEEYIKDLACRLRVPLEMVGEMAQDDVARRMRSARLAVVPSVMHGMRGEPSGLVPLECQASGTPTVVTRVGGLPENLPPHAKNLIADPSPESLASSILAGLRTTDLDLHDVVRGHVLERHDLGRVDQEWDVLYERALSFPRSYPRER